MSTQAQKGLCRPKWSYSLKTLLSLSFAVAICSALIGVSVVVGAACLPLIAGALVRTARIHGQTPADKKPPGLFATFCRSLVLVVCLTALSATALVVACCAGVLITLSVFGHLLRSGAVLLHAVVTRLWRLSVTVSRPFTSHAVHAKVAVVFAMTRDLTVTATEALMSACRALWRRSWSPHL
jgi:hypothetical protein